MKKISILLIAFLLLGSFAFAQDISGDVGTTFELTGEASATFGVDLEEGTTGFQNEASANLVIQFVPEQTEALDGDGWYGWVEVAGFSLGLSADIDSATAVTGTGGAVTARVTDGVVYVQIYAEPSRQIADFAEPIDATGFMDPVTAGGTTGSPEQGIIIGYGDDPINDLSLRIFSFGDWTENAENAYGVAVNADVQVDIIQIQAGVSHGPLGEDVADVDVVTGLGGRLTVDMTDDDDLGLSAYLGSDIQMFHEDAVATDQTTFIDLRTGLQFGIAPPDDPGLAPTNFALDFYMVEVTDWDTDDDLGWAGDVQLSFTEDTAGGLAPGIGAGLSITVVNLLSPAVDTDAEDVVPGVMPFPVNAEAYPLGLTIAANAEYNEGGLNPFMNTEFRTAMYDDTVIDSDWIDDQDPGFDFTAGVNLGADLHGIDRTTFTAQYEGIELLDEDLTEQYLTFKTAISW